MTKYAGGARVLVRPFAHAEDGDMVTLGDTGRQVFLSIPREGLDVLRALAEGRTVAEAQSLYEEQHGETPDLEEFLALLDEEGFVSVRGDDAPAEPAETTTDDGWLRPPLARRFFGAPVLGACAVLVAGALGLLLGDPSLLPSPTVFVFPHHPAALTLLLFVFSFVTVALHELAHYAAARAAGVPARMGVSHRLWILVAETDMTAIWLAPVRQRYLAFLAGPLVDAASASLLVAVLWAAKHGWFSVAPTVGHFVEACVLVYLLRLLWQCFFFVRTDFYYVFATATRCKNLLGDTEAWLRRLTARATGASTTVDQSAIPAREMRVIRLYSVLWVLGRVAAFGVLLLVTLPVLWSYITEIARVAQGRPSSWGVFDAVTLGVVVVAFQGTGLMLWIRGLFRARTQRRSDGPAAR